MEHLMEANTTDRQNSGAVGKDLHPRNVLGEVVSSWDSGIFHSCGPFCWKDWNLGLNPKDLVSDGYLLDEYWAPPNK